MKITWNQIFTIIGAMPCENARQSSFTAFMTSLALDLYENAKKGIFETITPKYGKWFNMVSTAEGIEFSLIGQEPEWNEFMKFYGANPILMISSVDRKIAS